MRAARPAAPNARRAWATRLARNVIWILPLVTLVWVLLTPVYNRFLAIGAERLVRLTESPAQTRLALRDGDFAVATRADFGSRALEIKRGRVTDVHFNVLLLATLFLAVPGIAMGERFGNLGVALICAAFFHLILLAALVKFTYATQLGEYSNQHFGAFAQNAYGLFAHLMDLPFKFALPLGLWGAFYLRRLSRDA